MRSQSRERADSSAIESFPNDKRVALTLHFPVEWWSTPNVDDQERYYEQYGARIGAWRLLEVFERTGVRVTCHLSGMVAELFPGLTKAIASRGHDIAGHGYDQSKPQWEMAEEEERSAIRATLREIENITGTRPRGWVSGGRRLGKNTVRLLAEANLAWHSHHDNGDMPMRVNVSERTIVDVPIGRYLNYSERRFIGVQGEQIRSCDEIVAFFKSQLDALRLSARHEPLCFQFGAHAHMFGLPGYSAVVEKMLEYALGCDDVWIATTDELVRYCFAEG